MKLFGKRFDWIMFVCVLAVLVAIDIVSSMGDEVCKPRPLRWWKFALDVAVATFWGLNLRWSGDRQEPR